MHAVSKGRQHSSSPGAISTCFLPSPGASTSLDQRALSLLLLNNRNLHAVAPKCYPTAAALTPATKPVESRTASSPNSDPTTCGGHGAGGSSLGLEHLAVVGHYGQDGALKDLLDALHLLAAALHVLGAHLLGDCQPLVRCHRCETLRLEHVDAGLLVAQVGLEPD